MGDVYVFDLEGHPTAEIAYAWAAPVVCHLTGMAAWTSIQRGPKLPLRSRAHVADNSRR